MKNPKLEPHELAELESARADHADNQPYASELDDRALEHAHKDKRPLAPAQDSVESEDAAPHKT